jgi:hypothetical protein
MLADVVAAVAETLGVEAAVEGASEEMAPEGEEAMDDFAPADEEMPAPEGEEMPAEEEEEPMMEMSHPEKETKEESVVAETVKRVTARLKKMNETAKSAKSREAMVESVVQRIMSKINKK